MKVDNDIVTFRFRFRGVASKPESLAALRAFLHESEWLSPDEDYDAFLMSYHTENDGLCEVILKKQPECSLEELADMFFADVRKAEDIVNVTVLYTSHTEKLVLTYAGLYLNQQKIQLCDLKTSDEVVILP